MSGYDIRDYAEELLDAGTGDATLRSWIIAAAEDEGLYYDGYFEGLCYDAAAKGLTVARILNRHK